MFETSLNEVE
jgi:chemotaxis protein histidine kinase CheA